jgi:SAM-dependent methyltransferase
MSVRVNIGCGLCVGRDWINIDGSWNAWLANRRGLAGLLTPIIGRGWKAWPAGVVHGDLSGGRLPLKDATVDILYSAHFVEHLTKEEGQVFFRECLRVLKPGARIRVVVPDLEGAARRYLRDLDACGGRDLRAIGECPGDEFMRQLSVSGPRRRWTKAADWYQVWYDYHRHFWMYDRQSLSVTAERAGFCEILVDVRLSESGIVGLDQVERAGAVGENGEGFALEAVKPREERER